MNFSGSAAKSSIPSSLAALGLASLALLAACDGSPLAAGSKSPATLVTVSQYHAEAARHEGGSVIVGDWESPTNFSPLFNDELPSREINSLIFSGLVRRDAQLRPVADLVVRVPTLENGEVIWDRAAQRMTVNYQLRPGLRWSDGEPLTSADLAFTWGVIRDPRSSGVLQRDGYSALSGLAVRDPLHFTLSFDRIYPQYLDLFSAVLPSHRLRDVPLERLAADPFWNRPDTVSGPFKISELVPDDHITLVRNEWFTQGRAGSRAHLDSILFRIYPEAGMLLDAARAGKVDLALELPDQQAGVAGSSGMSEQRRPALAYEQVSFNQADPNPRSGKPAPWIGDPALLQALRSSVDRSGIVKRLFQDELPVARSPISTLLTDFHDADAGLRFDPNGASVALDRDGWLPGSDGIRLKNGRRLSFTLLSAVGDPARNSVRAELIAGWRKIGVEVIPVDAHPSDMFSGYAQGGLLERGKFEAGLWTWTTGGDPDGIYPLEHSSAIPTDTNQGSGSNFSRLRNPEIDRSLERGRQTLIPGERVQAYASFERAYVRVGAEIPLFEREQVVLYAPRLRNLQLNTGPATTLWNAVDWWLG